MGCVSFERIVEEGVASQLWVMVPFSVSQLDQENHAGM